MRAGAVASVVAWALVVAVASFAFIRAFGLDAGFPLVPVIAFTPYVAGAAVLATVLVLALRRWVAAAIVAVGAGVLVAMVLPRAIEEEAEGGIPLRVLTANMKLGQADPGRLVELVERHEVDVLSVQEVTRGLVAGLERGGLSEELPHRLLAAGPGSSGGALYSRLSLHRIEEVPGSLAGPLPAATLRPDGAAPVAVYVVHPPPPMSGTEVAELEADLATIPSAGGPGALSVVAGDFNATLDNAALREVLDRGYLDAAEQTGTGLSPTWPAGRVFPPEVTIDHVLVDERAGVADTSVIDLPGSDHRAVLAEVRLPASR